MTPLLQATRTVPIVFVAAVDPVGAGNVDSLSRPGGNATGFMLFRLRFEREMDGAAVHESGGTEPAYQGDLVHVRLEGQGGHGLSDAYGLLFDGDLNRSTQHLLILLDKEVADGDVTDIVHGEAEG